MVKKTEGEHEGIYMEIPLDQLKFPPEISREVNMRKVNLMRQAGIDPMALQPLTISFRDGEFWIVDGGHRYTLLKLAGYETAPCRVFEGKTIEEDAKAFVSIQMQNSKMSALEVFRRKLVYKDQEAKEIMGVLSRHGLTLPNKARGHKGTKRSTEVGAIGTVETIYKEGGAIWLDRTFEFVLDVWGDETQVLEGRVLYGTYSFLYKYQNLANINEIKRKMKIIPISTILKRARGLAEARGGKSSTNFAASILYFYNFNKKTHKLPNLFDFDE